ncbi:hypothetical protein BH09BAC5_BH09BAC5_26210 [soil metagenome]
MASVLLLIYTIIFFFIIRKVKFFHLEGLGKWTPSIFFGIKLIAGVALWAIYTFYYTDRSASDIWKYFDDSKIMYDALHSHPSDFFKMLMGIGDNTPEIESMYYHKMNFWYRLFDNNLLNDAHIVIRFNAFMRIFSGGNYLIHALFMCFLSFTGLICIYKIIFPSLREWRGLTGAIIFMLPSLLFWTSGVMKEGIMILGLGVLIYHSFKLVEDKKWWRIFLIIAGALLLLFSKFYVIVGVIPPLIAALLVHNNKSFSFLKFTVVILFFAGFAFSLKWIAPEREPLRLLANKQNEFLKMSKGGITLINDSAEAFVSFENRNDVVNLNDKTCYIKRGTNFYYRPYLNGFLDTVFVNNNQDTSVYSIQSDIPRAGSLMKADYLQPTIISFVKQIPRSLYYVLLRPLIWEAKNPMFILPALENLFMLLLILFAFIFPKKISQPEIFGFCITFSILLMLVIGLTTPVLGALVRYRIVAQPFLLIAFVLLIDRDKLMKKFPFLTKLGI